MVGVAGRSKACANCRRRRVKCDETRPRCYRCQRMNLLCEGYSRELRFVDQGPKLAAHTHLDQSASNHICQTKDNVAVDVNHELERRNTPIRELDLSAFQDEIFITFTRYKLFAGIPVGEPWPWDLINSGSVFSSHHAIRAVSAAYFGNISRSDHVRQQGSAWYILALQHLARELANTHQASSELVLQSIMTLSIYEMLAFTSTSGWLRHAGGVGKFIQLRGPWRHQYGNEKTLFESSRMIITLEALVTRKRTFLAEPIWKTVPWAHDLGIKSHLNQLQDILCDLPGILESVDYLKSNLNDQEKLERYIQLCDEIKNTIYQSLAWRLDWDRANPGACFEASIEYNVPIPGIRDGQSVFSQVLHFQNLGLANEIALYDSILLILGKLAADLMGDAFSLVAMANDLPLSTSPNPLIYPGEAFNARALADEICRTVDYHLLPSHEGAGSFFLLFPLRVAHRVYPNDSREAGWIANMLTSIANNHGFELSRNLT